jgi:hypothetical protein
MAARKIPLRNQTQRGVITQVVQRRIGRHDAVRRLFAVARAYGLSRSVVTEKNVAVVAEFNLFPEYGVSSKSRSEPRP